MIQGLLGSWLGRGEGPLSDDDLRTRRLFAHNMRHLREEAGLTLRALADQCGISSGRLSELENAVYSCTIDTLGRLAKALGAAPADFFDETDFEKPKRKSR